MDLDELQRQFVGRRFGDLVLYSHKRQSLADVVAAMSGTIEQLPAEAKPIVESWIDMYAPQGQDAEFWRRDRDEVFREIAEEGRRRLAAVCRRPTSEDAFNMFQIILLNFVYGLHKHSQSKAFVQKALGIGLLGRIFSS